jgi:hypothetical protein
MTVRLLRHYGNHSAGAIVRYPRNTEHALLTQRVAVPSDEAPTWDYRTDPNYARVVEIPGSNF